MKGKVARLRLSPNEEARIVREEYERRRKLRIQQVREQQRCIALKIRRDVERRRKDELEQLGKELRDEWEREQREKINTLQALYHESLQLLGQGQRSAKENEPDWAAIAQREEENAAKAEERFREALKELKSQRLQDNQRQSRSINARKQALEVEKERSARVASLPLPPPNPIQNIDLKKPHRLRKSDVSAFATTYYHMAYGIVDREGDQIQPNAHEEAEVEVKRLQELEVEEMRRREEQLEKAHLRGKQALRREHLEQDRERLLVELEHMQQMDLLRRRQQVADMPPQIFQPLYKRIEMKEDFQRQMEFAFEDMYAGERRVKGDLVVQLVPEPLLDLPTGSQDQELDVTLDEVSENTQPDAEEGSIRTEEESSIQEEQTKPPPKHPLKKLLDRIRGQRDQRSEHDAAADSPTVITDEIPEKDTTIDTGSLTSAEKSVVLSVEIPRTTHDASEASEQSPGADTPLPDERSRRHEERKKRDEDLEREKLEQLALLQELEEQKAQLEQMLLKTQQERQQPKVVVTQEEDQPQSFTSDHEVSSAEASDLTLRPDEDDHTSQIREYQHQLLERTRVHQRSVEVARQRLEEYQRALQMRYNMAAQVPPPHQPALLGTRPSQVAAGLSRRAHSEVQTSSHDKAQTPRVIPTKESVREPRPPDARPVPDAESFLSSTSTQTTDVSARLTEGILRVTERIRDRLRSVSVPSHLPNTPDPIQTICPSTTDLPVQTGTLPQDSVSTLPFGPTRDHMRQRDEQQEAELQRSRQPQARAWDVEEMRRQKRYLQALIHSDAQAEPVTDATPEEQVSENAGQTRRNLLESLLKAIEHRNGGTLSHLEDAHSDKGPAPVSPQSSVLDEPLSPKGKTEGLTPEPLDQRGPGDLDPEGKERGWDTDAQLSRRQPEMLQLVPEPPTEDLVSEDISQIRRQLFASLLKAIAEKSEGALSPSEASQVEDEAAADGEPVSQNVAAGPYPASVHPDGLLLPPQAARPPVTRVKTAVWEMSQQHELSAIPEVETPVNTSLAAGLEDSPRLPRGVDQDSLEGSDCLSLLTSCGQQVLEKPTSSGSSSRLMWTERLLRSWESSPQGSVADSKTVSPLSSDSGRGADYSGPAVATFRSPTEACPDPDSLSTTTTISTGSYVTTDPEHSSDKSPTLVRVGPGAELLAVFSPGEGVRPKDSSAAESPHVAVERLFSHSGVQRIIDKYTKLLNLSLCSAGPPSDCGGSDARDPGASAAGRPALLDLEESERAEGSGGLGSVLSDDAAALGNSLLESAAGPAQEQDSFRPLVGQSADQSSCLAVDQRDSAMERLVGHPSAHSSLIGQLPGLFPLSLDHSGWDSTLTRMIGRLAHRSGSERLTGDQGPADLQPPSEHVTTWLDGGPEESQMRPLVQELDESAGQQLESSGEGTRGHVGGSDEVTVPPTASLLDGTPRPQPQTVPAGPSPERTRVWDSFHPLMAEVTHNETAEPSMSFYLPGHDSPHQQPSSWDPGAPTSLPSDDSGEPERSLESFRAQEPVTPASHDSFSLLITSEDRVRESVLASPPLKAEPTALFRVTTGSGAPAVNVDRQDPVSSGSVETPPSGEGSKVSSLLQPQDEKGILEQSQITLASLTDTSLQDLEETLTDEAAPDQETGSVLPAQPHDRTPALPATLLECDWGPGASSSLPDICQQKRRVLLQRSSQRVEELRARRARSRSLPRNPGCRPPAGCKAKAGPAERSQTAADPGPPRHKNSQAEAPEETRICTTEQRKLEASEMHQRTRRLYEQLEEVKQQKAVRSRQEASTQNRLKAKEFHRKTLQKLRAKQTPR